MAILVSTQITGTLQITQETIGYGGFVGNLEGTASWATNAVDAINAINSLESVNSDIAIYALNADVSNWSSASLSASYALTASYIIGGSSSGSSSASSSYALTASYALNGGSGGNTLSASWASRSLQTTNATSADFALVAGWTYTSSYYQITQSNIATSASWASSSISSSYAFTASYALNSDGGTTLNTGSTYPITSSWTISASYSRTASLLLGNASSATSASWASSSISSSYSLTASYALNGGSDGATNVTQSIYSTQSLYATQSISSSYAGTASLLLGSVLNALTSTSASWASRSLSSSYSLTASYALNGGSGGTGGITGSGTINYVPIWISTSSLSSTSSIYDGGTTSGVSIGTTSSFAKLTVYKNGATGFLWTSGSGASGGSSNPFGYLIMAGTYGNGKFVAFDFNGYSAYTSSNNGLTWGISATLPVTGWMAACYGDGKFVAVSQTGHVITSSDATNWATQSLPSVRAWSGITYGSGSFLITSGDYYYTPQIMTSPDGGTWTTQSTPNISPPNYSDLRDVVYGDKFVAVITGEGGYNKIIYSTDGTSWTFSNNIPVWSPNLYAITYGNGKYVVGAATTVDYLLTSTDAVTWITQSVPSASRWMTVGYGGGYYIAIGYNDVGTHPYIITSTDAITWTSASAQSVAQVSNMSAWGRVSYGNNTFVAVASYYSMHSSLPTQQVSLYVDDDIIARSITASLLGTASWAISASYAPGGSGTSLQTGSTYPVTSSWAISASWAPSSPSSTAVSASWASSSISSSYSLTASLLLGNVSNALIAISASWASSSISSSYSLTASYALNGGSGGSLTTGSTYPITSSWAISASWSPSSPSSTAISASWASSSISASYAPGSPSISASYALTASYILNTNGIEFTASGSTNIQSNNVVVIQHITGSYGSAVFDYVAVSGSNQRAGMMIGTWNGSSVSYTEMRTTDIGNTSDLTLAIQLSGNSIQLVSNANSYTWFVEAISRYVSNVGLVSSNFIGSVPGGGTSSGGTDVLMVQVFS